MKEKVRMEIKISKKKYYDRECERLTTKGSHRIAFNALKHLNKPGTPQNWNIRLLYPEKNEKECLEALADFFNEISGEFVELEEEDIPTTYDRQIVSIDCLLYTSDAADE